MTSNTLAPGGTAMQGLTSRKVFFFTCEGCRKKRRQTFRKSKAETGLCRSCRHGALNAHRGVDEKQLNLFSVSTTIAEPLPVSVDRAAGEASI